MKLVLASNSASRKEILTNHGYSFVVDPSDFDESKVQIDDVKELVVELAKQKAINVAERHKDVIILAADTLVYHDGKRIGQQSTGEDAMNVLRRLNGRTHEIFTGICLINASTGMILQESETTLITLKAVPESELEKYVKAGLYKGRAGCYNISDPEFQGFIDNVRGSYTNIRGLPIEKIEPLLKVIQDAA